ncbi:MAG: tetratricopeptide repeat protein [Desulfovibrionaceae bacterium]|jgi:tetratricopeptide (TPR) repeat protein|nr:tetratricopeptide repeat protein [Desulfovibrionaceae bacterium]
MSRTLFRTPGLAAAPVPDAVPADADAAVRSGWTRTWMALLVAGLAILAHYGVLDAGFLNYDDNGYVTDRAVVLEGLTGHGALWAFTSLRMANWHPLTWLAHMLDVTLWGTDPMGHHLTSLLLHAANAALLFLFLARATGAPWRALAAAALFAVHPMHVESVAWISERKDVLSVFFGLLGMLAYTGYARAPAAGRMAVVALCMALSLMCKPMLVTLPCVLLLLDFWPLGRVPAPAAKTAGGVVPRLGPLGPLVPLVLEKWPLFALSAASCVITVLAQDRGGAMRSFAENGLLPRLANALAAYGAYLGKAVLPHDLAVIYPFPASPPLAGAAVGLTLVVGLGWLGLRLARRAPFVLVGWLWFLGALVPVIGIVQVGLQSMADRYAYFPYMGLYVAAVWSVWAGAERLRVRAGFGWAGPWLVLALATWTAVGSLVPVTWVQTAVWKDSVTLFEHALASTRNNFIAHCMLGAALSKRKNYAAAGDQFRAALRINPEYPMAFYNMGLELLRLGRYQEALSPFQEAVKLNARDPNPLDHLGIALFHLGRAAEGMEYVRRANAADPGYAKGRDDLGYMLMETGRLDEALASFDAALTLDPSLASAHYNKGVALLRAGDRQGAARSFARTLQIEPKHVEATYNLGALLLTSDHTEEAVALFRRALALDPGFAPARRRLAELGRPAPAPPEDAPEDASGDTHGDTHGDAGERPEADAAAPAPSGS